MKKQVFYLHGGCAFSEYKDYLEYLRNESPEPFKAAHTRWNKRLATDLGDEYETFMPDMPNKFNAQYIEWQIWFENHLQYLRDDVILIGYSMGAMFYQKYLINNELPVRIKALILIAPPHGYFKDPVTGEDGGDFNLTDDEDVTKIARQVSDISIYHSKDDFAVPYESAVQLQAKVPTAELVTFEDRNHFLVDDFLELLDKIKEIS